MTLRKNMIRAFRNTMNPPQLPGSFFVDLSGNAEMLDTLLHWHERKTDFMLNFLCQLAGYEKHWIPQLFSNQKADVYRAMPFIAWLGDTLKLLDDLEAQQVQSDVIQRAVQQRIAVLLPLLLKVFDLNVPIEDMPVVIEPIFLPIGSRWGLKFPQEQSLTMTIHANQVVLKTQSDVVCVYHAETDSFDLCDDRLEHFERFYLLGQIEVIHHQHCHIHAMSNKTGEDDLSVDLATIRNELNHSFQLLACLYGSEGIQKLVALNRTLVVKVPQESGWFNSSSGYQYPFSCFLTTYPKTWIKSAESILHETMHILLGLYLEFEDLYLNPDEQRIYRHPWMDIPRPMRGVFLGAHAFTNVCDFYRRILADEALSQTQAWCKDQLSLRVSEVARALGEIHDHADLTASGLQFVSGLDALWLHASQSLPQPHAQVPALTER